MVVRLHALTVLASDPEALASFWGDLLGWERAGLDLLPDADAPMRLSFEAADLPRARLNQVHVHLTSYTASQEANVARVLELAADGTREVGVFWAAALDWPLVHDEDGETAIQPPEGGMKIAWGGPPLNERADRNRMHLVLVADDLDAEVERLVSLGASVVARGDDVEMADPDGNEFRL